MLDALEELIPSIVIAAVFVAVVIAIIRQGGSR